MALRIFNVFVVAFMWLLCNIAFPETITSNISTHIDKYYSEINYGDSTSLVLSANSFNGKKALIKWDLSGYTSEISNYISNVKIRLRYAYGGVRSFLVKQITSPWDENQVNWLTQPQYIAIQSTCTWDGIYYEIKGVDLDSVVRSWIQNPASNFGILVENASGTDYQGIYSDDAVFDYRPQLMFDVNYVLPEASLQYKFNELGSTVLNSGSLNDCDGIMYADANTSRDMHKIAGGVTGDVNDGAFLNQAGVTTIGNLVGLNDVNSFTITAWIKPTEITDNQAVIFEKHDGYRGVKLAIVDDQFTLTINNQCATSVPFIAQKGNWVFIAVTFNGVFVNDNVKFYIGSDRDTATMQLSTCALAQGSVLANNQNVYIGNDSSFGNPFLGFIDNVSVFVGGPSGQAALLRDQIEQIRLSNISGGLSTRDVFVTIDVSDKKGAIDRRLFGMCGVYGYYDSALIEKLKPILNESSLRVWWSDIYRLGTQTNTDELISALNVATYLVNPYCGIEDNQPWHAVYNSLTDNNLGQYWWWQTPEGQADMVDRVNNRDGFPHYGIKYVEIWNEPHNPPNGSWDPNDYARYVADCSVLCKQKDPNIKVGACLTPDITWNQQMLGYLDSHGLLGTIDFCIIHRYNWIWWQVSQQTEQYYAKVFEISDLARYIRETKEQIAAHNPAIELALTEWNTHPVFDYSTSASATRDLGTAIFQASALRAYMDEGVNSANIFQMISDANSDFGLTGDISGEVLRPTWYVFEWFGKYFKGQKIDTETSSPSCIWNFPGDLAPAIPATLSPYVEAVAADDGNNVSMILINKHISDAMEITVNIRGSDRAYPNVHIKVLNGVSVESDIPIISESVISANPTNEFNFTLPAHSVTLMQAEGCGRYGYPQGDLNRDCYVNLADLAILSKEWQYCTLPEMYCQ